MNIICNIISCIAVFIILAFGSMLDSTNTLPMKLVALALAWLMLVLARREGVL